MTTQKFAVAMTLACGTLLWASVVRSSEGEFTAGSQWWTQTTKESKFQEFREVPRGGFLENFLWREWSGRNSVVLWGANGLHSDQVARLTVANGARWRADLGYLQIPHLFSQIARSPYVQTSPGWFTLPDSLQAKNQANSSKYTATMLDLLNASPYIPLQLNTNISTARLRARPARGWTFDARGSERERSGLKPYAMTFGFSTAIEIPEPIDQRMLDADLIANYQRDKLSFQASGGVSRFTNRNSVLRVDNPKRLTDVNGGDGPKVGALDLYPDNRVVRGSVALTYLLPRQTALAATVGMSQSTQDDNFLPPTSNKALPQSTLDSLPARSLNAKAVQTNADVRLTSRPFAKLQGALKFHLSDYDNQTPELNFLGQAPYDVSWQRFIELKNKAFGNKQWLGGGDLDYDLMSRVQVGANIEYRVRERTHREVEKDNETVYGARAKVRMSDDMHLDVKYSHGDRKLDAFLDEEYEGLTPRLAVPTTGVYDSLVFLEQKGLRRYDIASRKQDKVTTGLSCALGDRIDLSGTYAYLWSDFPESQFGLQNELEHTVAADVSVHVSDQFDLEGGYGFDVSESNQASRESNASTPSTNPLDNWAAHLKDTDVFVSAGFEWWPRPGKCSLTGDYQGSRHLADFDLTNGRRTAQSVPSTIYRVYDVTVEARYQWLKHTSVAARYGWEEYDVSDWATNDVPLIFPVTGTANAVFLGNSREGYIAHRIALVLRHSF